MERARLNRRVTFLLILFPLLCLAASEEDDWNGAQQQNSVRAYDQFLANYPQGSHREAAVKSAAQRSVEQLTDAAKNCEAMFPRMIYYAVASSPSPLAATEVLDAALADAGDCGFAKAMTAPERLRATDGLLQSRPRFLEMAEKDLPARAIIALDAMLIDLESGVIQDAYEKIVRCSDQSAWTDTSPKKAYECSRPHREAQVSMAQNLMEQTKYDFEHISRVADRDYRLKFWDRYRKLAKNEIMQEISAAFKLYEVADRAKAQEKDPDVAKKIDDVVIRLAGGKPTGSALTLQR